MKKMDCFLQKLLDEKRRNWSNDQRNMTLIDVMLDLQQKEPEFYTHEIVKGVILVRILIYRSIYSNFFCQQILFSNNLNFKITKSNDSYYSSLIFFSSTLFFSIFLLIFTTSVRPTKLSNLVWGSTLTLSDGCS
jgi:hypothetical protein